LIEKKMLAAFSKSDLADDEKFNEVAKFKFGKLNITPLVFSSVTNSGLSELKDVMWNSLEETL
jgi:ethanolamine utilization protein EutP (predicted NTPase)